MLTRKYYEMIAQVIKENTRTIDNKTSINKASLINDLSYIFVCDNNNFDKRRFIDACND